MRKILVIIILTPMICASQQIISLKNLDLSINTSFNGIELEYIDSIFNNSNFKIYIAKLLPDCSDGINCYEESVIRDDYNWGTHISDSTFGTKYFKGINYQYIDSSSFVEVDFSDYPIFLSQTLKGQQLLYENEVITICYNPRHAVFYFNELGNIFAIHEVCFECNNSKIAIYSSEIQYGNSSGFKTLFKKYNLIGE